MIKIYNGPRFTHQSFFEELINYLAQHEDVTLRKIKKDFPKIDTIDRQLESFIKAGYIIREDRRYRNGFDLSTDAVREDLRLNDTIFVDSESSIYPYLEEPHFKMEVVNSTNEAVLVERVAFTLNDLSFSSYFEKIKRREDLSPNQEKLYAILGDVNQDYALKHITTFLLKFTLQDQVLQRRPDIFVQALEMLGYIRKNIEDKYELKMSLDNDGPYFRVKEF